LFGKSGLVATLESKQLRSSDGVYNSMTPLICFTSPAELETKPDIVVGNHSSLGITQGKVPTLHKYVSLSVT